VDKRENEALGKIDKLAGKARDDEQSELSRIDKQLAQRLSEINRELQGLDRARENEKSALLNSLQQAHISGCLANASIFAATIPGIGTTLSRTLQANGIRTAADFTGIGVINDQVYVRLASGRSVHPQGIGRMKAQALESWRQSLVTRARMTQPTSLPPDQSIAITGKYAAHRAVLEGSARDAKDGAGTNRQLVHDRWKPLHADIAARMLQTRSTYAQYRSDADFAVITARRSLNSATWLEAASKHRLSAYSGVKYSAYLARSIRS
jgi:DNA-binding helix-hairpin-helix protein with protein kinase domain